MHDPDLNFRKLRKHRNSQNDGFEELTRQLVLADPPDKCHHIENRGPGADGGVEILVQLHDSKVWGWQSKFFLDSFGASEVSQLKNSFASALQNFSTLERYYVAIPRNLSGAAVGKQKTQTQYWENFKNWVGSEATKAGRTVQLFLWDESYFIKRLQANDPMHAGMREYWFQETVFTRDWFQRHFDESRQYIGKRYREEDHIDLNVNRTIRLIRRAPELSERIDTLRLKLSDAQKYAQRLAKKPAESVSEPATTVAARIDTVLDAIGNVDCDVLYNNPMQAAVVGLRDIDRNLPDLRDLQSELYREAESEDDSKSRERPYVHGDSTRHEIQRLVETIGTAAGCFSNIEGRLFKSPNLLVTGEAGSGKSHLLAEEVRQHIASGGPACFIPARAISNGGSPKSDILTYLGLAGLEFETWLAALSAAGHAWGKPALIVIDGINESFKAAGWESGLPVLLAMIERHSNLALIVSIRSAYKKLCVRDGLSIPILEHRGFSGDVGRAAKEYLDRNGIERPSAPILGMRDVLYNPLFLSTAVDALVKLKRTTFPRDLDNISVLIDFWFEAVERNLIDKDYGRIAIGDGKTQKVIQRIAEKMATSGAETVAFEVAHEIAEDVIGLAPPANALDRFIQRLIDEGVFIDYPSYESGTGKFITFGFQKFSDYFVADHILAKSNTREELAKSLIADGGFSYLFGEDKYYSYPGIRTALFSLTPERFGCELPSLHEGFAEELYLDVKEFIDSLTWRSSNSITKETLSYLEHIRARKPENGYSILSDSDWYTLLLNLALLPDCILNAEYLANELKKLSLAERDASWSAYLVGRGTQYEDDWEIVFQLIDWAWLAPKLSIDPKVVELAKITLGLMTSTIDRQVRDCASKALANLMVEFPSQIAKQIRFFSDWADPYVRERVLAAAASGVLYSDDKQVWHDAAIAANHMVFAKEPVERHAWTRRYGQFIVDHARENNVSLDAKLVARSHPPYASKRITNWPTIHDIGLKQDQARSIVRSVVGFIPEPYEKTHPGLAGDFGRYTMGGIDRHFSREPRGSEPPLSRRAQVENFWQATSALGTPVSELAEKLKCLYGEETAQSVSRLIKNVGQRSDDALSKAISDEDLQLLATERTQAEGAFVAALPEGLANDYRDLGPLNRYKANGIPTFPMQMAQCWVVERCLELGWSSELHENTERRFLNSGYSGHEQRVERIGKKYQHIAHQELLGYLADHHWFVGGYDDTIEILMEIEDCERQDIDITFFAGAYSKPAGDYDPGGLAFPKIHFEPKSPASNKKWTEQCGDVPEPTQFFIQKGDDGYDWSIVNFFCRNDDYYELFDSDKPLRSCQFSIELVMVQEKDVAAIVGLNSKSLDGDDRDVFDHSWPSSPLYGQRRFRHFAENIELSLNESVAKIQFERITDTCSPKYSGYDNSGSGDESDFFTPKPALISYLKLKPANPWSRLFVNEKGEPAFVDRRVGLNEACIVRSDLLGEFARDQGLKPVWRVWVEKDGGEGTKKQMQRQTFVRKDYIGYFTQAAESWQGMLFPYRHD